MLGEEANTELHDRLRADLGLDQSLPDQYAAWVGRLACGAMGCSVRTTQPVCEAILQRLPVTIELTTAWMLIAISAGIVVALRRNSGADIGCSILALRGVSEPSFFLALLLSTVY